jgi:acetyltransferase-like isoleucine patch superfamily enzyme
MSPARDGRSPSPNPFYRYGWRIGTEARKLLVKATHTHCTVEFQGPVRLGPGFALDIADRGTLIVGPGVDFRRGFICEISSNGVVRIGAGTTFTANVMLQCTTSIDIGVCCNFAQSALVVDGSHRFRDPNAPVNEQGYDYRPIVIGDHVTVSAKATVMANVGTHSFVGAHAVVNRDIPAYCLAVGVPARAIDYFGPPELRPVGLDV